MKNVSNLLEIRDFPYLIHNLWKTDMNNVEK
ncbi:Uncharacterised protein [Streptococcus acidominimus]|uniref:Uncharacterized protein n=1 Tax=Streptococcus acidominimus TaxID=1326 RepID=A0A380IDM9_STRAI|nr:Uncharacterised protein [Streptococcus acidominimus]